MTLEEARKILQEYNGNLAANKLPKQIMDAKWVVYNEDISKKYPPEDYPHLEPDYFEGWK
jgi:hypothetical protein